MCNKIISLDLPVIEVYKKIWCAQPNVRAAIDGVKHHSFYPLHVCVCVLLIGWSENEGGLQNER